MAQKIPQEKPVEKQTSPIRASVTDDSPTQISTVDSAISLSFTESTMTEQANSANPPSSSGVNASPENSGIVHVQGMPYSSEALMEMGAALTRARRDRMFPPTITPGYNVRATIDDYEDLMRLNAAREGTMDARDEAFRPDIARLYIDIQRRIQDRDLTYGEVAADSNVRARIGAFANSAGAETGMYNLMRHAMNSVLRLNNLTADSDNSLIDAVATRVVNDIRATVHSQATRGAHGVDGVNMESVLDNVFGAIENALDGQVNNMSNITNAQSQQVNAIASHVNAIDNHVHAMGNNVNAMGALLNSTNGNVTSLTTNIGVLQTIVNMLPQMVTNAVQDMLPGVIGGALEAAISNELLNRMQVFVNAAGEVRAQEGANGRPPSYRSHNERRGWFSRLNIFKKRNGRGGPRSDDSP